MQINRYPIPYSKFILCNFTFSAHTCKNDCNCHKLGCTEHWQYSEGRIPNKEQMRYILATWQAFRNKPSCKDEFLRNFSSIAELVKPLSNMTILCSWEDEKNKLVNVYDNARAMLCDSVVCATKTLHFFAPDLFLILDRAQVFRKWKNEMRHLHFSLLKGPIESIDGKKYVSLMSEVKRKLSYSLENHQPVILGHRYYEDIVSVESLRWLNPMKTIDRREYPNTITKALDNLIRGSAYEE